MFSNQRQGLHIPRATAPKLGPTGEVFFSDGKRGSDLVLTPTAAEVREIDGIEVIRKAALRVPHPRAAGLVVARLVGREEEPQIR